MQNTKTVLCDIMFMLTQLVDVETEVFLCKKWNPRGAFCQLFLQSSDYTSSWVNTERPFRVFI